MRGLVIAAVLLQAAGAFADERAQAREHYIKGTKAFELGLYDEAIQEYMAAYKAKDDPALLYNIAQSHRLAGHASEALRFYRVYLAKMQNAPNREEVQTKIEELQRLVDQQRKTQQMPPDQVKPLSPSPPSEPKPTVATVEKPVPTPTPTPSPTTEAPAPTPTPTPSETPAPTAETPAPAAETPAPAATTEVHAGRSKKYAGIAIAAVGVAALAAGIGLSVTAKSYSDDLTTLDMTHGMFDQDKSSNGKTFDAAGAAMLAIGGVAVVAGVIVAVLGFREAKRAKLAASLSGGSGLKVGF